MSLEGAMHRGLALIGLPVLFSCQPVIHAATETRYTKAETSSEIPDDAAAPWLEIDSPGDGLAVETLVPLVEVRGRAGAGVHGPLDIVLTVDTSGSVFSASGIDLDRDGIVGEPTCDLWQGSCGGNVRNWTTDFDDIVIKVELDAAQKLVGLLNPETTRMALVKFGDTAFVEQPLDSLAELSTSLEGFRYHMRGGTDIVAALHRSIDVLEEAPPRAEPTVGRAILLLTDGDVAFQGMSEIWEDAYVNQVLGRARAARVRVFTFGVGPRARYFAEFLREIAGETGGRYVRVHASADIAVELPLVSLSGLSDVELRNDTNGETGRAVRVFPDGSFDGYAPLAEGDNSLTITTTLDDGRSARAHARVRFTRPVTATREHVSAAESLLQTLRTRTVETDLARRAQAEHRRRRLKQVEIEADPPAPP